MLDRPCYRCIDITSSRVILAKTVDLLPTFLEIPKTICSFYLYIYLYISIYIYLYISIYLYLYISIYISIYIYIYISIYIYIYIYIYTYFYIILTYRPYTNTMHFELIDLNIG